MANNKSLQAGERTHHIADQQRVFRQARELASLLIQHDRKQAGKRGHNRNALPLYLEAVHSFELDALAATDPVKCLGKYFTTNPANPADFCLAPVRQFVKTLA